MTNNIHNRLGLLRGHLDSWMERRSVSRQTVTIEVVEAVKRLEMEAELATADIFFRTEGDAFAVAESNSQKLFRWLGYLNSGEHLQESRLFYLERAIVAAMPHDIRSAYMNETLRGTGLCVATVIDGPGECIDQALVQMIKEVSEAQQALIALKTNPELASDAEREINEASATLQNALGVVKRLTSQAKLKAVE